MATCGEERTPTWGKGDVDRSGAEPYPFERPGLVGDVKVQGRQSERIPMLGALGLEYRLYEGDSHQDGHLLISTLWQNKDSQAP